MQCRSIQVARWMSKPQWACAVTSSSNVDHDPRKVSVWYVAKYDASYATKDQSVIVSVFRLERYPTRVDSNDQEPQEPKRRRNDFGSSIAAKIRNQQRTKRVTGGEGAFLGLLIASTSSYTSSNEVKALYLAGRRRKFAFDQPMVFQNPIRRSLHQSEETVLRKRLASP